MNTASTTHPVGHTATRHLSTCRRSSAVFTATSAIVCCRIAFCSFTKRHSGGSKHAWHAQLHCIRSTPPTSTTK